MPQGGATVVHEAAAAIVQLETQVDVLVPVHVAVAEATHLEQGRSPDEQARGGQGRHVADRGRPFAQGVTTSAQRDRQRSPSTSLNATPPCWSDRSRNWPPASGGLVRRG